MDSINGFFKVLFGNYLEQNQGFIELRQFESSPRQVFCKSLDEIMSCINNFQTNGYFGVCPRVEPAGEKCSVSYITVLWADIDYGREGHNKDSKYQTKEEALLVIQQFEIPPSIIVFSGHGFQPYWLLSEPELIDDEEKRTRVESILKGIAIAIGGDSVHDVSRVLRIPGTENHKVDADGNKLEPKLVKIIKFEPSLKYSLDAFSKFQSEPKHDSKESSPRNQSDVSFLENIERVDVEALGLSDNILELIKNGNDSKIYPSRSECDQAVIVALLASNLSQDVIKAIFSDERYKIGEKYRAERVGKGDAYLTTNIKSALAYLGNKAATKGAEANRSDSLPAFPIESFPTSGFLAEYVAYASEFTDAPVQFHVATALSLVSTVLARTVYINRGCNKLFPVLWVAVLAESGIRKSTSQDIGKDLLRAVYPHRIASNEFTKESLVEELSDCPVKILCFNEISSLLAQAEASYNRGMKTILVDLYDCPPYYTRKLTGKVSTIKEPFLNILGASTTEWFIEHIKEAELRSGFLARFIYICADKRAKSLPLPPPADLKQRNGLIKELQRLGKKHGEIRLSAEARKIYEAWYVQHEDQLKNEPLRSIFSPFYVRFSDYLLKIAMLFAINDHVLEISQSHMERAIVFTDYFKDNLRYYLTNEMAFSPFAKEKNKLKKMIQNSGFEGVNHSKLLRNSNKASNVLAHYIVTLIDCGDIYEVSGPKGGKIYVSSQFKRG